jgi:hypothetical protein
MALLSIRVNKPWSPYSQTLAIKWWPRSIVWWTFDGGFKWPKVANTYLSVHIFEILENFWYILCQFCMYVLCHFWYILCQFCMYVLCHFSIFYVNLVYFMSLWYILCQFDIFYVTLVYFVSIWYILWAFGILCDHLLYFSRFGMLYQEKCGVPDFDTDFLSLQVALIAMVGCKMSSVINSFLYGLRFDHRYLKTRNESVRNKPYWHIEIIHLEVE